MKIIETYIYRFSIPMHPFTIATGVMTFAQNLFIRVITDEGHYGVGECSAFPMIVGETQATCFEMAKEFATLWKGKDALNIEARMQELHHFAAFNATIKSAFDMALHDLAAKHANQPLYQFLGGSKRVIETDITIGIDRPERMAAAAAEFKTKGARIIKIKLGKNGEDDIERVKQIRLAVGEDILLRVDANQGWDFETAAKVLKEIEPYRIQFCEQPMRFYDDDKLPALKKLSPVKLMADESVFNHYDAERLIQAGACDYINIKFSKSGGILEATKIADTCKAHQVPCMIGGMLETRIALSAFGHFAMAHPQIIFYDMDTCMVGHKADPVTGGLQYNGFMIDLPDTPGIGADADEAFLQTLQKVII